EELFIKNSSDEIVGFATKNYVDGEVEKLITNTELKFFCIEPVTVSINGEETTYATNSLVDVFLKTDDSFSIITTSDKSIASLYAWPGALGTYYTWLEGVNLFDGILFDMNDLDMYSKWSQGNQGMYHVQFAQYNNCIFWSDNPYVSAVTARTNYTLYYTTQLPLCYSTTVENTFKAFYFAYNVTSDPNWVNPNYKASFSAATWATQCFSYYGLKSIGLFDMDSSEFNIVLPKDCRGLMFYSPNIQNAGVFDAINCTNFGAKSGSWRDAFAYCYQLENLYIKNLTVNLNVSWSPINQQSIEFILSNAANTKAITISLSPYTYYRLSDATKALATEKNITLALITTNYLEEDKRVSILNTSGVGTTFLSDNGTYKEITIPTNISELTNDVGYLTNSEEDPYITKSSLTAHNYEYYVSNGGILTERQYNVMIKYLFTPFMVSTNSETIIPDELLNESGTNFFADWYWNVMRITGGEPIMTTQWVDNIPYKFKGVVSGKTYIIDFNTKKITPEA
ncbi:MAG: hypothetical protein J6J23_01210, partial [Clostridia bacterium]|nr:hypothetical protein [Clostridia bacterium]